MRSFSARRCAGPARAACVAALLVAAPYFARAAEPPGGKPPDVREMRDSILDKLSYDRSYFQRIATLREQGKSDTRLPAQEFESEVRRAQANLPVLERFFAERDAYLAGKPLSYPESDEVHRVYTNLIALLNLLQATEKQQWQAAIDAGEKVAVRARQQLGRVRGEDAKYYLKLYREFFHLMSVAHFRLGHDVEAVSWLSRIESDADVLALKQKAAAEQPKHVESRAERLAVLRERPIAVVPLTRLAPDDKESAWIAAALPEVLGNDLVQHSDLIVVDRNNVQKVLKEVALSLSGVTEERMAQDVGRLLAAGTLLSGSYRVSGTKVFLSLRLLDVDNGRALAAKERELRAEELFADGRALMLELLGEVGFLDAGTRAEMAAARAPRPETMRSLLEARLLLASKRDQAKALFAKAMKEDPAYARMFEDLKSQFSGVAATVALMPLVNAGGAPEDLWMIQGTAEALSADLPKIGFTMIERQRLAAIFGERRIGQIVDPESARNMGQALSADFVVLGSLIHQKPRLRADVRFVDVRTGVVAATVSAEDGRDDLMQLLLALSTAIARRFNEKLSQDTLNQLAAKRMTPAEFERFARQELAKDSLRAQLRPTSVEGPSRAPFWGAVAGVLGGSGLAAGGFLLAKTHSDAAGYNEALERVAVQQADWQRYDSARVTQRHRANLYTAVGIAGLGIASVSLGYIVYQEIKGPGGSQREPGRGLQPVVASSGNSAFAGVGGSF
jgi:TolB-like protein